MLDIPAMLRMRLEHFESRSKKFLKNILTLYILYDTIHTNPIGKGVKDRVRLFTTAAMLTQKLIHIIKYQYYIFN